MFPYLLGALWAKSENDKNEQIDPRTVNIGQLEALLADAKMIQQPNLYSFTDADGKSVKPNVGYQRSQKAVDIINDMIKYSKITKEEVFLLANELKQYEKIIT